MNIFNIAFLKLKTVAVSVLISVGILSTPPTSTVVEKPIQQTSESQESIVVKKPEVNKSLEQKQKQVLQKDNLNKKGTTKVEVSKAQTQTLVIPQQLPVYIPSEQPQKIDIHITTDEDEEPKEDALKEQENLVPKKTDKKYDVIPQEGSPLKPRTDIDLDQLRAYVISTNGQYTAFRQKMQSASESELITYLNANGFEVVKK